MTDKAAINDFRIGLIAQHTRDAEVCVKANLMTAYKSLQRTVAGIDVQLDSTKLGADACDLTHLRARLITAADILLEEIQELSKQA